MINYLELNLWQEFGAFSCKIYENSSGVLFRDSIHFLGEKNGVFSLCGFRVPDKEFFEIDILPAIDSSLYVQIELRLLNGHLCIIGGWYH